MTRSRWTGRRVFILAAALSATLPACSMHRQAKQDPYLIAQKIAEKLARSTPPPSPAAGSLWDQSSVHAGLVSDNRAFRTGDIVRVRIDEQTDAKQESSTDTSKQSAGAYKVPSFFGLELEMNGRVTPGFDTSNLLTYSRDKSFSGEGATSRSNEVDTIVSSRVVAVLPNGNLVVAGSKDVTVNRETQTVWLAGVARPIDLSSANTVVSSNLSDLEVHVGGRGDVDAATREAWLARFLDRVMPF